MPIESFQSIINLTSNSASFCNAIILTSSSCFIHAVRNDLTKRFLELDKKLNFDFVCWIDSDIVYGWQEVKALIDFIEEKKIDFATGLYYNFKQNVPVPVVSELLTIDGKTNYYAYKEDQLKDGMVVDGAGFGFICMRAKVLKDMAAKYGDFVFWYKGPETGKFIGEDNLFCDRAKQLGYPLYLCLKANVGHCKTRIIGKVL